MTAVMTTPMGDDGIWTQLGGFVLAVFGVGFGVIRWFLGKLKEQKEDNEQAIFVLRNEMASRLDAQDRQNREDRNEQAKFRELVLQTMATRNEVERALDRQTQQIVDRLDARFSPFAGRTGTKHDG